MYLQFYGFKEAPFNLTPDSKFLFLSHRHQEALAALLFGVQERKGFICLTGEIGCGKTTLCRALLAQLDPEQVKTAVVLNSYLTDLELLKTINEGFGLPAESDSKKMLLDVLNEYLVDEFSQGHNIVLIIDEAQNLRPETLEQIRMISNLETETAKLLQIILVGQPELRRTLTLPELEQLNQRITVRYHITALDEKEIPDYIKHRLSVAEPQVELNFTPQAFKLIYHFSRGVPRRINVICDRCLLVGYIQGTFEIDDKIVNRAVNEVRGENQAVAGPTSGGGSGLTAGLLDGSNRALAWAMRVGLVLVAVLVITAGVWLGISMAGRKADPTIVAAAPQGTPIPFPTGGEKIMEHVTAAAPDAPAVSAAASTPAQVSAAPTPKPSPTPPLFENWQNDADGVLRVRDAQLCEPAAYIMMLRLWDVPVDITPFKDASPDQAAKFDMSATVEQINFRTIHADKLNNALTLDLPVLVRLDGAAAGLGSCAVINSMNGEVFEMLDPMYGKKMVQRRVIEPHVLSSVVLYRDQEGLTGVVPGERSERVRKLQIWLAGQALYTGPIDGHFGGMTREAIEKLQGRLGLPVTGMIDQITAAQVDISMNPRRPRLYS